MYAVLFSLERSTDTKLPSRVLSKISSDGIINWSSGLLVSESRIVPELSIK